MQYILDRSWNTILFDLGVRPSNVLRAAGLPDDAFAREEQKLELSEFIRFWDCVEEYVQHPALPVFLAQRITAEALAPPLFAALCSRDFVAAMERLTAYKRLLGPGGYTLSSARDGSCNVVAMAHPLPLPRSLIITELTVALRIARMGTRTHITPTRAVLDIPDESRANYDSYFGVSVEQGESNTMVLSRADAERVFVTDNHSMWAMFEPSLRMRLSELEDSADTQTRVRAALLEMLPAGASKVDLVARRLGLSRRTLQRQLTSEGWRYQDVLAQTRYELAQHYLQKTNLTVPEISYLLAFEQPRSFFRAFMTWSGASPESYRKTALASAH